MANVVMCQNLGFGILLMNTVVMRRIVEESSTDNDLAYEFAKHYKNSGSGRGLFDEEIAVKEEDIAVLDEIGRLAIRCTNSKLGQLPLMAEVAQQLETLMRCQREC
uniref:Uncharacterized protein n=1 Tax=Leersia perrieri TaxID=77586 RepID=A0A0D9XT69_9ORYZ